MCIGGPWTFLPSSVVADVAVEQTVRYRPINLRKQLREAAWVCCAVGCEIA